MAGRPMMICPSHPPGTVADWNDGRNYKPPRRFKTLPKLYFTIRKSHRTLSTVRNPTLTWEISEVRPTSITVRSNVGFDGWRWRSDPCSIVVPNSPYLRLKTSLMYLTQGKEWWWWW